MTQTAREDTVSLASANKQASAETELSEAHKTPRVPFSLSPEAKLVIECAKPRLSEAETAAAAQLVAGGLDWEVVLSAASMHGLMPRLFHMLSRSFPAPVPANVMEYLRSRYTINVNRNLMLTAEAYKLLNVFEEAGIEAIPYKGPIQAAKLYGNLALREIADLDFIVRRGDVLRAKQALLAVGYFEKKPLTPREEKDRLKTCYDLQLRHEDGIATIELHWRILPSHSSFGMNPEFFWNYLRKETFAGRRINGLPPEIVFLMLCIHIEKHNWSFLKFLSDIACLLELPHSLDWEMIFRLATQFKRKDSISITCCLVNRLLSVPVSDQIASEIKSRPLLISYAAMIRARLFQQGEFSLPSFSEWLANYELLRASDEPNPKRESRFQHFKAYLFGAMLPEYKDRRHFPWLPRPMSFLYLFSRLMRYAKWNLFKRSRPAYKRT